MGRAITRGVSSDRVPSLYLLVLKYQVTLDSKVGHPQFRTKMCVWRKPVLLTNRDTPRFTVWSTRVRWHHVSICPLMPQMQGFPIKV